MCMQACAFSYPPQTQRRLCTFKKKKKTPTHSSEFVTHPQTPTCLDDELGALVAGEQSHVHDAAFHVGTVLVHDGVELGVTHCNHNKHKMEAHNIWNQGTFGMTMQCTPAYTRNQLICELGNLYVDQYIDRPKNASVALSPSGGWMQNYNKPAIAIKALFTLLRRCKLLQCLKQIRWRILTVRIFGVEMVFGGTAPRQQVVIAAIRHTIITNTDNFFLLVYDTCSHLWGKGKRLLEETKDLNMQALMVEVSGLYPIISYPHLSPKVWQRADVSTTLIQ